MNKQERVVLHRERLHKEVWQTPVSQLAKQYGMSDVGLAKICKRMGIPLPPRGYWAKKSHGHAVRKKSLQPLKGKDQQEVALGKSADDLLQMAKHKFSADKLKRTDRQLIHRLQNDLKDWEMSNRIRAYITAMQTRSSKASSEHTEFLAWAATYADHLDPAINFRMQLLETE